MKAVLQRVQRAWVDSDGRRVGEIGPGLLVLLGVARGDTEKNCQGLCEKVLHLRIFDDDQGKMNRSVLETHGALLVVSQFTLLADCRKGRRPSYVEAAPPEEAKRLYECFVGECRRSELQVETGIFQAKMQVELVNDGPVTILLEL